MPCQNERQELAEQLDVAIEAARDKAESGRVYDVEKEQIRLEWLQTLNNLVETKRRVLEGSGDGYE